MPRVRVSTTVDETLLADARRLLANATDAVVIDAALRALMRGHRAAEIDAAYAAYDEHPLDEPDEWGDLAVPGGCCHDVTAMARRGELWWCELPEIGRRPIVVLSRDAAILHLRRVLVAPCTTTIRGLPTEVVLEPGDDPVGRVSAVNLDSVESVSLGVLVERIGKLSHHRMLAICAALEVAVDCGR